MVEWIGEAPFRKRVPNFNRMSRREIERELCIHDYRLETVIVDVDGGYEVPPGVAEWLERKWLLL